MSTIIEKITSIEAEVSWQNFLKNDCLTLFDQNDEVKQQL